MKVTSKNFSAIFGKAVSSFVSFRDDLQDCLIFAMQQVSQGNYTYANAIMNEPKLKGADMRGVQNYVEGHCDVTLGRDNGKFAFINNKTKGFSYVAPTTLWQDYKPTAEPVALDPTISAVAFLKKLEKALKDNNVVKGKVQETKAMIKLLKSNKAVLAKVTAS